ncbi:MAG: hydrogenase maturation nickel metallochaperone HypA [Candidatus Omnitrophota bacterium]|nr:hydrogenase maturation nickel metallochaperone HypA [Candidatus Omnitrophota bacterium]MBU2034246.1 hydrogenase maturation nickel metallochaperone HypA [Candidatus Omnitrophota bacterium]MBU2221179.1 hydrogenase maturation nickel metallochaperone HypA [Candidatus Omnitrophota bacterium]
MHETRFINEIFAVLNEKLAQEKAARQVVVNVRLSPFSHVSAETLQGSFKELSKGENFTNACLKVLPLEVLLECKECGRSTRIAERIFGCPFCNSADVNIQMDMEFFVESIEIEDKEREAENGD